MVVKQATAGMKGADIDRPVSGAQAKAFLDARNSFIIRYIPRKPELSHGDLTSAEIAAILGAGMGIGVVQHVSSDGWNPNAALGSNYGSCAASYAKQIGLPPGMQLWLDLEGVADRTPAKNTIDYATEWYTEVLNAGFVPGLYCGFANGLAPQQLYNLPYKSYWRSYNYYDGVPTRGYCMVQHTQKTLDGITYDPDTVQADNKGGLPLFLFSS